MRQERPKAIPMTAAVMSQRAIAVEAFFPHCVSHKANKVSITSHALTAYPMILRISWHTYLWYFHMLFALCCEPYAWPLPHTVDMPNMA